MTDCGQTKIFSFLKKECLQEKQGAGDKSAGNENAITEVFDRNLIHMGPECFMTGHHQATQSPYHSVFQKVQDRSAP